jgi:DNA polymerase III subunit beta
MIDSITGEKIPDFFFSYSENQICFQLGTKTLYSRTLSGQFPNYTLLLPTDDTIKTRISVNTQELRSAVKRVSKMSESKTNGVKFLFGDNLLRLIAQEQSMGKGEEFIEIDNLECFDMGVNSIYLMDFLNRVTTDKLSINFKDSKSQCLLVPENNEVEYKYVIMPMRL